MKSLLAVSAALALAAPSVPNHGPVYSGMPPERMQGDSISIVAYVTDVPAYCGKAPPGLVIHACVRVIDGLTITFLPNPCPWGNHEYIARLACHEMAHASHGWTSNHQY